MDAEAKFQALVEQSLVGIYILEGGVLRYVNPGFVEMFGFQAADELIDVVAFADLVVPEERAPLIDLVESPPAAEGEERRGHFTGLKRDGSRFHFELYGRTGHHAGQPALVGVLVDVSDLRAAEANLARQAFYDSLTGLPNRTLFFDRLHHAMAVAEREDTLLAFLFLDLDGFKTVNDSYGHSVGDQVLTAVAGRLVGALRATDTLARLGGDEFGVITTGLGFGDDVEPIAHKLIASMQAPIVASGHTVHLGVSIGIALYPHHAEDADGLYRAADTAMYLAKKSNRGGYCFADPDSCGRA